MKVTEFSIRPFIGAINFAISRQFYQEMGFEEVVLGATMSLFQKENIAFYLQNAYVKEWVDNTMIFVEVKDVQAYWDWLQGLNLTVKYPGAKLTPIKLYDWGKECFVHDPSGILWHFGEFKK